MLATVVSVSLSVIRRASPSSDAANSVAPPPPPLVTGVAHARRVQWDDEFESFSPSSYLPACLPASRCSPLAAGLRLGLCRGRQRLACARALVGALAQAQDASKPAELAPLAPAARLWKPGFIQRASNRRLAGNRITCRRRRRRLTRLSKASERVCAHANRIRRHQPHQQQQRQQQQ